MDLAGHAKKPLQVAVGIVTDSQKRILVACRPKHVHQGGLWEFPGGKIHAHETVAEALTRELQEELGIEVLSSTPLITIQHDYPDLAVQLNVRTVNSYDGVASGCEGQAIQWVTSSALSSLAFPAANLPIINAVVLPEFYAILDASQIVATQADVIADLLNYLQRLLAKHIKLIQIRLKTLPENLVQTFLKHAEPLCTRFDAQLLINSDSLTTHCHAHGIHLTSTALLNLTTRPNCSGWLAASCHTTEQLQHAAKLGVDFVVIAPVLATATHPEASALGWEKFAALTASINIPAYALGGMNLEHLELAKQAGAQGLCGIRLFVN